MTLSKQNKTWIVTADRAKANIYEWINKDERLEEVIHLEDSGARKPERSLRADRPGHGQGFNSQVEYTMDEHVSYKLQQSHIFQKELADYLIKQEKLSKFDTLVVIASDEIHKILLKNLPDTALNKISKHHAKNLTNMPLSDVQDYYKKYIL